MMEKYDKVTWGAQYFVGVREVDEEHSGLFAIYNQMVDLVNHKGSRKEFAALLSRLTDYGMMHFKREEAYMTAMGYPDICAHRDMHRNYVYKVAMFNAELLSESPPDPYDVLEFIRKWWTTHIQRQDTAYEKFKQDQELKVGYPA